MGRSLKPALFNTTSWTKSSWAADAFAISQWPYGHDWSNAPPCMGYAVRVDGWTLIQWLLAPRRRTAGATAAARTTAYASGRRGLAGRANGSAFGAVAINPSGKLLQATLGLLEAKVPPSVHRWAVEALMFLTIMPEIKEHLYKKKVTFGSLTALSESVSRDAGASSLQHSMVSALRQMCCPRRPPGRGALPAGPRQGGAAARRSAASLPQMM